MRKIREKYINITIWLLVCLGGGILGAIFLFGLLYIIRPFSIG